MDGWLMISLRVDAVLRRLGRRLSAAGVGGDFGRVFKIDWNANVLKFWPVHCLYIFST
jgi:hypothetical protein